MAFNPFKKLIPPLSGERDQLDAGLVLSGGGARAAYQVGVLQYIGESFPDANFSVVNGVSAGAINSGHVANHVGSLGDASATLTQSWRQLTTDKVYSVKSRFNAFRLMFGGAEHDPSDSWMDIQKKHGMVDSQPLRDFLMEKYGTEDGTLHGIRRNIESGALKACAITTTNYQTGQTVTWVEGKDIVDWERPNRVGRYSELTVDHIIASTALPLFFPAVCIDGDWYGDGGIRLASPLAPAIHLGADRILAVTTRYGRSRREAEERQATGYPPAAQIMGILSNAVFLDALDQDVHMLQRINRLVEHVPARHRNGLRRIEILMFRPSVDLGKLASEYQMEVPPSLRFLMWGTGSRQTKSPDSLSLLLFQQGYLRTLMEIGYEDARRKRAEIEAFFAGDEVPFQEEA